MWMRLHQLAEALEGHHDKGLLGACGASPERGVDRLLQDINVLQEKKTILELLETSLET